MDAQLAASAVVEGSATVAMVRFLGAEVRARRVGLLELVAWSSRERSRSDVLLAAPRYYAASVAASYVIGAHFLSGGMSTAAQVESPEDPARRGLEAARRRMPASTEQVLHPEKYAANEAPFLVPTDLVSGATATDSLGELLVAALLTDGRRWSAARLMRPASWTPRGAVGWAGDRVWVMPDGTAVWATVWDTPRDRAEFVRAARRKGRAHVVRMAGERSAILGFGMAAPALELP
jgi:hypothetical protein